MSTKKKGVPPEISPPQSNMQSPYRIAGNIVIQVDDGTRQDEIRIVSVEQIDDHHPSGGKEVKQEEQMKWDEVVEVSTGVIIEIEGMD